MNRPFAPMLQRSTRTFATAALFALAAAAPGQDLLVRARTVVLAADAIASPGTFLVRQGKVAWVGDDIPAEARAGATVVDYGDATIVPGFVLPPTTLGRDRDLAEGALAFTPDLRASEAFDPWQEELQALPKSGITSMFLSPSPRNVAGGIGALVKPGQDGGKLVAPDLQLTLSLTAAARNPERQPTSLMGAMDLLRTTFTAAQSGLQAGPDAAVLRQALQGGRRIVVHADTYTELMAALDLAKEYKFEPVLVGAADASKVLPRLVAQKAGVVLGSLRPNLRLEQLQLPTRLAEAGVQFCFGGRAETMRLSAVLAVRHGLDRKTALQALTRNAAVLLDQANTIGSLRQGHAADFAVFTGDPIDLDSNHLATWIDGVRVHGAAPAPPAVTTTAAGVR
jgi:imidazolonepropionase-like amidohydrolase